MALSFAPDTVSAMKCGRICTSFLGMMLVISVALPTAASAKRFPPITGKLSGRGYTVLALSNAGDTTSVRVKGRSFKLRPPAKGVTLHLRAPDGAYAGPVVVASPKNGKSAILGVKAGVKLGNVKVKGGKGYAKVQRKLPKKFVVKQRKARAKKGVPIGAGNFGLVGVAKLSGPRSDPDLDGVPSPLDIDDDGDLVLDDYDRSPDSGASAAQVGGTFPDGSRLHLTTSLGAETRQDSVNVDGGSTPEQVAAAQQKYGHLNAIWAGIDAGSGELDCGTLIYCSAGGTGRFSPTAGPPPGGFTRSSASPFPECCDSDGDGLGSLIQGGPGAIGVPGGGAMAIFHGATSDQIRAGDLLIARGTFNGEPVESPASVGFVFSTFPVLAAYSDGQGDSSTFSYSPGAQSGPPPPVRRRPRPGPMDGRRQPLSPPLRRRRQLSTEQLLGTESGPGGAVVLADPRTCPQCRRVPGSPRRSALRPREHLQLHLQPHAVPRSEWKNHRAERLCVARGNRGCGRP